MANINNSLSEINNIGYLSSRDNFLNRINPLAKLVITLAYIAICISFPKEILSRLLLMLCYLIIVFFLGDISFTKAFKRINLALPFIIFVGIFNPILDRNIVAFFYGIPISSGLISFTTLLLKGVFSLLATYALITSTSLDQICYSLRRLKIPSVLVTSISLTCRYLSLIVNEANEMWQAYSLRAPSHKGLHIKSWGSFVGSLLIRTIDRANLIYESMLLRGFNGDFDNLSKVPFKVKDFLFIIIWMILFIIIRLY